jgi:hypothetical protein
MLVRDAQISTDLAIRPGQVVRINGDASLPQPPVWAGGGGFEVQERGSLSLTRVTLGVSVLRKCWLYIGAGGTLSLSGVAVPDYSGDSTELTGTIAVSADGGTRIYNPPSFASADPYVRRGPVSPSLPPLSSRGPFGYLLARLLPRSPRPSGVLCASSCSGKQTYWPRLGGAITAATQLPGGFAEAYTLRGCANPAHCGVFTRVAATCTSGDLCPGGANENSGNADDPSLCAGAPVYQRGNASGPVLLRYYYDSISTSSNNYNMGRYPSTTYWFVAESTALKDCLGEGAFYGHRSSQAGYWSGYVASEESRQPGPPTLPGYFTDLNPSYGVQATCPGYMDYEWTGPDSVCNNRNVTVTVGGR